MNGPAFWRGLLNDIRAARINRTTVVAGGAVRDWLLGIEPHDIDIYVNRYRADRTVPPMIPNWTWSRSVGIEEYPGQDVGNFNVHEYVVDGTVVQLMLCQNGFWDHYNNFDHNLTKAVYDNINGARFDEVFLQGLENKVITPINGRGVTQRMARLAERLNEYEDGWTIEEAAPAPRNLDALFGNNVRGVDPVQRALAGVPIAEGEVG